MNRDTFYGFHPFINLLYFVAVIGFTMFFMHPACLAASLLCAVTYSVYINKRKAIRFNLVFMLPILIVTAALSPLFNHQGATILAYLPNGNPITLESVAYGAAAAVLLIAVMSWFSCFSSVITSDKFVFLFGRVIPALSLALSIALRFIPRFIAQAKVISNAQKCIGRGMSGAKIPQKARNGVKIVSILVTWALENAIETADSMKGRGYGLPGRTAFSIFRFDRRDAYALVYILACAAVVVMGSLAGAYYFRYYPTIKGQWAGNGTIVVFAAYLALGLFPIIVNIKEDIKWSRIKAGTQPGATI